MTKYVVVTQKIRNYEEWKPAFDRSEELRHEYGVRGGDICRSADDPNEICVALECDDLDRARQLLRLPAIKKLMKEGGVIGEPVCWFMEQVAKVPELAIAGHERQ